ncbi:MAG TPA: NAD(P)-binding domain-containing protein [Hanamia sp.]
MAQKKSIAIIGATEKNGEEIATHLSQGEYNLLLISNNKEALDRLSEKMKGRSSKAEINFIECVKDGCWEADIIILAVPHNEEKVVAKMMKEVATQKIVVDFSNEENAGDELGSILPYSKLVKISGNFSTKEIVIRGDDEAVKEEISEILIQAGYTASIATNSPAKK